MTEPAAYVTSSALMAPPPGGALYAVKDSLTPTVLRDDPQTIATLNDVYAELVELFGIDATYRVQATVCGSFPSRRVFVDVTTPMPWSAACDAAVQANYILREMGWPRRSEIDFMLFVHSTHGVAE